MNNIYLLPDPRRYSWRFQWFFVVMMTIRGVRSAGFNSLPIKNVPMSVVTACAPARASLDDEHAKNHLSAIASYSYSHFKRLVSIKPRLTRLALSHGTLTTSTTWLPAPMRSRRSDMAFWYSMKWANVSSLMRLSRVRI